MKEGKSTRYIHPDSILIGWAPRSLVDVATVDYFQRQESIDPITVFEQDGVYWLADGYHRLLSRAGRDVIMADVYPTGGERGAFKYALGANAEDRIHPRTEVDTHRSIRSALLDPEIGRLTSHQIAGFCKVHNRSIVYWRSRVPGAMPPDKKAMTSTQRLAAQRAETIRAMVAAGKNDLEIAEATGLSPKYIRSFCQANNIALNKVPISVMNRAMAAKNTPPLKRPYESFEQSVMRLDVIGETLAHPEADQYLASVVDKDKALEWIETINQAIQRISAFRTLLRERVSK